MTKALKFSLPLVCLLIVSLCQANELSINGNFKTFLLLQGPPKISGRSQISSAWLFSGPLRLSLSYVPEEYLSLNFAYNLTPKVETPVTAGLLSSSSSILRRYRLNDFSRTVYPGAGAAPGHFAVFQNLDRAYVRMSLGPSDMYIGRQAIASGSARMINPTDVVAPYPFEELDSEERIGVDALKIGLAFGPLAEVSSGYILGRNSNIDSSAVFIRGKLNCMKSDVSLTAMQFRGNDLLGFDVARTIGGAGFWFEGAYVRFREEGTAAAGIHHYSFRFSTGMDYRFSEKIYAFGEYHFSADGESDAGHYPGNSAKSAFTEGTTYLMARHYFFPDMLYQITPLCTSNTEPLINLNDGSVLLTQAFEYNLTQNSYVKAGAFWGLGKRDKWINPMTILSRSEFGNYPDFYYISFRFYF